MQKIPYPPKLDDLVAVAPAEGVSPVRDATEWRRGLPTLCGALTTLRELRPDDAPSLLGCMTEEVTRFIPPSPTTVDGFERFIAWAHQERAAGRYVCFAIVPRGADSAIGVLQLRSLDPDFWTSEWGFALAVEYWGTGIFTEVAELGIDFAFQAVGAQRLEARAALRNTRGTSALRKMGAVQEGILRRSFLKNGEYLDQGLWTILREEWMEAKAVWGSRVIH